MCVIIYDKDCKDLNIRLTLARIRLIKKGHSCMFISSEFEDIGGQVAYIIFPDAVYIFKGLTKKENIKKALRIWRKEDIEIYYEGSFN